MNNKTNNNPYNKVQASPYIYATINFGHQAISGMLAYKEGSCIVPICIKNYPNRDTFWHGTLTNASKFREIMKQLINDFRHELNKLFKDKVELQKVYIGISPMSMTLVKWTYTQDFGETKELSKGIISMLNSSCIEDFEKTEERSLNKRTYIDLLKPIYYTDKNFDKANSAENISMLKKKSVEVNQQLLCIKEEYLNAIKETLKSNQAFPNLEFQFLGNPLAEAKFLSEKENQNYVYVNLGAGSTTIYMTQDGLFPKLIVLPLGGDSITNDIKNYFSISDELAESIKLKYSKFNEIDQFGTIETNFQYEDIIIEGKRFSISNLNKLVYLRMKEILLSVKRYIEREHQKSKANKIIFYGGGAKLKGLKSLLGHMKFKLSDIEVKTDISQKVEQICYNQHEISWDKNINDEQIATLTALVDYVASANDMMDHEYGYSVHVKEALMPDFDDEFTPIEEPIVVKEKTEAKHEETINSQANAIKHDENFEEFSDDKEEIAEVETLELEEVIEIESEELIEVKQKEELSQEEKNKPKEKATEETAEEDAVYIQPEDIFGDLF